MANDESNQRDRKNRQRDSHDMTFPQEVAKSYIQNWLNALGKWGMESWLIQAAREVLVEHIGPDMEKFLVTNGLTLGAAAISIRSALVARGVPEWVAESLDEGLNDLLEGARTAALDGNKWNRQGALRVLKSTEDKMNKRFIEEVTFEKSLLMLGQADAVKIDNFFFALPLGHQKRFNALKPKLKTPGDIRLFLQRVEMLMQAHPHIAPSRALEMIEPAYGVTPPDAQAATIAGILGRIKGVFSKVIGKADKVVTEAVTHPERAIDTIATGLHDANQERITKRVARQRRINQLKGMR